MEETYLAAKVAAVEDIDFPAVLHQNVGKELELCECCRFPFVFVKMCALLLLYFRAFLLNIKV